FGICEPRDGGGGPMGALPERPRARRGRRGCEEPFRRAGRGGRGSHPPDAQVRGARKALARSRLRLQPDTAVYRLPEAFEPGEGRSNRPRRAFRQVSSWRHIRGSPLSKTLSETLSAAEGSAAEGSVTKGRDAHWARK